MLGASVAEDLRKVPLGDWRRHRRLRPVTNRTGIRQAAARVGVAISTGTSGVGWSRPRHHRPRHRPPTKPTTTPATHRWTVYVHLGEARAVSALVSYALEEPKRR